MNRFSSTMRNQRNEFYVQDARLGWIMGFFILLMFVFIGRIFYLQVVEHKAYAILAADQHGTHSSLIPKRGTIYVQDRIDEALHPVAQDKLVWQVYVVPREITDAEQTASTTAAQLKIHPDLILRVIASSTYAVIAKDVPLEAIDALKKDRMPGIGFFQASKRLYPERGFGGQLLGFVSGSERTRTGKYGIEGAFDQSLAGVAGWVEAEKDAAGRTLPMSSWQLKDSKNGNDLVLTIDRTIQYKTCEKIKEAVLNFQAESGMIAIMDPKTGALMALCGFPDFQPETFGKVSDFGVYNNPATFVQFEPGSIFKPITMSIGLETGKITPKTTYEDRGEETMDGFTIRNSDKKTYGLQTMTQVLEKSLNTGTIFVQRLVGNETFRKYLVAFGFGKKTEVGFSTEAQGDISSLTESGRIYGATASFGQGISVTPMQILSAFSALANGGRLMKPYIVQEIIHPDGFKEKIGSQMLNQIISSHTARLISGMMVQVVEVGHGKRAGVPGYYVAGKTGTAQISNPNGKGYLEDATIGSFVGYAPADNPQFVMLVKIDKPKTVQFAESSAAPTFGDMAKFLLNYLRVPPERRI